VLCLFASKQHYELGSIFMPESDISITERLTKTLESLVPLAFGDSFKLSHISPMRFDRRYSFVFRYWMVNPEGKIRPLFVKIPHPSEIKTMDEAIRFERVRAEIKYEFEIMHKIANVISQSQHPGLFAIKPGGCILDLNAIVMEEFKLTMMKSYLWKWGVVLGKSKDWANFETLVKLAGEWLKVIHDEFQNGRFATLLDLGVEALLNDELEALEKLLGYELQDVRKLFLHTYNLNKAIPIPVSSLHHDFHLGNIFVTEDGRVGALDPNWKESGSIFEDLASLLIDPLTRKFQVMSFGLLFRSSLSCRFEKAILRGYLGKQYVPPRLLYFYCAFASLVKWRANEELLNNIRSIPLVFAGSIISKYTGLYFSRLVKTYLCRELEIINQG